jgi:hypothetical protein
LEVIRLGAVIRNGKVNGKPIIRAWESFTGWYWLAVEKAEGDLYFGLTVGFYPEWGYFSAAELATNKPMVWELKKSVIELIEMEVKT